tara:strand:- start:110 stop:496 length:387 start_codon:yes stop_codon:yes gene_type:complete
MNKQIKNPTRGQIRYLLKKQNGRCALTGEKLDPKKVSPDHIIPISRNEFSDNNLYGQVWLVSAGVNRMRSNLTLEEFYKVIDGIFKNKEDALKFADELAGMKDLPEIEKKDFDEYIEKNYDQNGIIKI